jgi:hypothetical protein
MADIVELGDIMALATTDDFVLQTIGFANDNERNSIRAAGLEQFEDFRYLTEKDIRDMAEEFGKRTVANGRIVFGLGCTKKLIGTMHWVQDCYRSNDPPERVAFNEQALFEALSLSQVRKADIDLVATNAKAVEPGRFKDECKWPQWEKAFANYLAVIPGVTGIPLSYVIREHDVPENGREYSLLTDRMITRASLQGQFFVADAKRVHNLLLRFLQGESTENWIRSVACYQDGRRDMEALRRHYAGEGNSTRCIADAKQIQQSPHYKSERALSFSKFLDSLQRMFTIFENEGEPLTERAKVDKLLTRVQNSALAAVVAQLRYQLNTTGVTFTVAANNLNSEVSQTPDYRISRRVSTTSTIYTSGRSGSRGGGRGGRGNGRGNSGRGRGGKGGRGDRIEKTSYYSPAEWEKLSFEERDRIRKERDKKGEPGGMKRSISEMTTKQLTTALISSIQKANAIEEVKEDTTSKKASSNAGDSFGGRESAKRTKMD